MPEASEIKVKFFEINQKGRGVQIRPRSVLLTRQGGIEFLAMLHAFRGGNDKSAFKLDEAGFALDEAFIRSEYGKAEVMEITSGDGLPEPVPEPSKPVEPCLFSAFGLTCVLQKGHKENHTNIAAEPATSIVESGPAPNVNPDPTPASVPDEIAADSKPSHQPEHSVVEASGT